jgi:predicted NBD/HSP70 family sugar kinase
MPQAPKGSRKLIRELNRSVVLNMVKEHGSIGRAEIARRSGLSPAAITSISGELIEEGWMLETDTGESSGGRRPILLQLNPNAGYVIGIKLAERSVLGVITDLNGQVIEKQVVDTNGSDPEAAVKILAALIENLCVASRIPKSRLLGVGVGLAGVVDASRGTSRIHPFLGWQEVPIGSLLQSLVNVPVYLDNDVNTLTYAERLFGRGQGVEDFIVVTVGRGVGMGMVLNGQLYAGSKGGSGEFGHTVVKEGGPLCDCGKNGCLETFVGEDALLRAAKGAHENGELPAVKSLEDLIDLGLEDVPAAMKIFEDAGAVLGLGIANLINLFNPALILIGGEGVRAGEMMFGPMRVAAEQHTIPVLWPDTEIIIDPWGDDAWAIGAASLVLGEVFRSPVQKAIPNSSS